MKVTGASSGMEGMDAEAVVAAKCIKHAAEDRKQARHSRREAQQDQVKLMKQATDKLREMATNARWKGALNCAAYAAEMGAKYLGATAGSSAVSKTANAASKTTAAVSKGVSKTAEVVSATARATSKTAQVLATSTKVASFALNAVNKVDPIGIRNADLQADKQMLETEAQVASQRAQEASDQLNEAQRAQSSMTQLMEKVSETRNNVRMTALKG
jgi:hypothetical protein